MSKRGLQMAGLCYNTDRSVSGDPDLSGQRSFGFAQDKFDRLKFSGKELDESRLCKQSG